MLAGERVDFAAVRRRGQPGTLRTGAVVLRPQGDVHVEVGLGPLVAAALEQAQHRCLGGLHTREQVVRRVGSDRHGARAADGGVTQIALGRLEQATSVALALVGRIDHQQAYRSPAGTRLRHRGDDPDAGITAHDHPLVIDEQGAGQFVSRRWPLQGAPAEGGDGVQGRGVEGLEGSHNAAIMADRQSIIEPSSASCTRARSRLCPSRATR